MGSSHGSGNRAGACVEPSWGVKPARGACGAPGKAPAQQVQVQQIPALCLDDRENLGDAEASRLALLSPPADTEPLVPLAVQA